MSTLNHFVFTVPSLLAAFACASAEPDHKQPTPPQADAATAAYDNPREARDAGTNDAHNMASQATLGSTAASTNDGATTVSPTSERSDAGTADVDSTTSFENAGTSNATSESPSVGTTSDTTQTNVTQDERAVVWEPCGSGKCATIAVPVDYDAPAAETLGLRVFVGPATAERRGVVYFNPGGPGVPVVAEQNYQFWYEALNALMPTMDIVLIDNRGIGESQQVNCISSDDIEAQLEDRTVSSDLDFFEFYGDFWRTLNTACVEQMGESALSNLHTVNVARDMDKVREVLGEEKINLWMVSYGTVQASVYAALFPERVGAFVLDSPAYVGQTTIVDDVISGVEAYEHELSRFLDWCAIEETCGLGDTKLEVDANYDALIEQLDEGILVGDTWVDDDSLAGTANELLRYGEWDAFAQILIGLTAGDFSALVPEDSGEESDAGWQFSQANAIYRLMDLGCPASFSAETALALGTAVMDRAPRMGPSAMGLLAQCVGWYTRPSEQRAITKELPSVPLLIVTSAHDAATPLNDAEALQSEFNNGTLLYVSNKEGHGVIMSDENATEVGSDYIKTGRMSAFCDYLPCYAAGETDLALSSLRVLSKPVAGVQRLPAMPTLPRLRGLQR